jgi:uncharacterized protein (DUF1684 family)
MRAATPRTGEDLLKQIVLLLLAFVALVGATGPKVISSKGLTPYKPDSAFIHRRDWDSWRQDRLAGLAKPDGWLSLAGLYWLKDGDNRFGSAEDNPVRFPDKAPAHMGTITLADGKVRVSVLPGVAVTSGGAPVLQADLKTDTDGTEPTMLKLGTMTWYVIQRADKFAVRIKDTESPELKSFKGVPTYPYDDAWRIYAKWEAYDPPKQLQITNIVGQTMQMDCPGAYVFEKAGAKYRLEPTREGNVLFLVFGDSTSGRDTYGGGRFLYTSLPDADGKVMLDFNRAYNPPCAFTPWATCPLPTAGNKLATRVEAGEKLNPNGVTEHGHQVN